MSAESDGIDVRRIVVPLVFVVALVGAAITVVLYLSDISGTLVAITDRLGDTSERVAQHELRLRDVELRSSRNEERSLANQSAIEERLRRIEQSLSRLDEWIRSR